MSLFFRGIFLLTAFIANAVCAQAPEPKLADRIVAIVDEDVITYFELQSRLAQAIGQLKRQDTPLPPREQLEEQMLERLIIDKIQLQFARVNGVRIDDAQLENALQNIAKGNGMSLEKFQESLHKDGIPFARFREDVRNEMAISRTREREVENKIQISEGEIDNFLFAESAKGAQDEFELAHILLRIPESASPEEISKIQAKANDIIQRLQQGENFSQLAAAYSDAPDGLQGGNLGKRSLDRLPVIFAEAAVKLNTGEVAPILRSPNGFHIFKLLSKSGEKSIPAVQQTRVRHILIKVNELVSESEAQHKLEGLLERIKNGESFSELARLFSQDGSASKGGDLGWIYPGDTVPDFERVMDALPLNEVSTPTHSPFGFHLIEVLERRVQDVSSERQRALARQTLRERKMDEAYQDWLRQLRDNAHIEIKLDDE